MDGPVLSAPNICYELAEKTKAIAHGGIGAIHRLVQRVGLATRIDTDVRVLKVHQPYYESDHVLNIAYNLLCGGQTLDDIELRRTDRVFLDALGTDSLPDPTTAGDFCRRFDEEQIEALMDAINETRLEVWQRCPGLVEETARIDGDGTLVPTTGACKEGMDIAYNGVWGYGPLLVSLANTGEPLFIKNRSANRPSHESAIPYFDKAVALCRRAGFTDVLLRGDTDFALTTAFDRWTTAGVRFVFGYDATATMVRWGQSAPPDLYEALVRRTERTLATAPRQRPANVKDRIVTDRGFKKITPVSEALVDFDYQPTTCTRPYRVVALKEKWVYPGFPTIFSGLLGFFVGDFMGKALWQLVENAQRFPRRGGRVLCVHGAVSFHGARPWATRWLPGRGARRDVELDRCVLGLRSGRCSHQNRRPVQAERSIYPGKTEISGTYALWETRI